MKTVLVLSILLCAAWAAPAEDKEKAAPEAAVEEQKEQMAAVPERPDEAVDVSEMKMKEEEVSVPEDSVPVLKNARFNPCPDGWFNYGSRCFMYVNDLKTWYRAEEHCNNLGGHLASATNPREYSFLQQLTQTGSQSITWLGGFYLQNQWLWIDRQGFYYNNWYHTSSPTSYPCLYLRTSSGWGRGTCSTTYRFICSKNVFGC